MIVVERRLLFCNTYFWKYIRQSKIIIAMVLLQLVAEFIVPNFLIFAGLEMLYELKSPCNSRKVWIERNLLRAIQHGKSHSRHLFCNIFPCSHCTSARVHQCTNESKLCFLTPWVIIILPDNLTKRSIWSTLFQCTKCNTVLPGARWVNVLRRKCHFYISPSARTTILRKHTTEKQSKHYSRPTISFQFQ